MSGAAPRRSTSPTTAGPGDEIAASAEGRGPLRASHADREQAVNIFVPFAAILVAMLLALPAWLDRHASRQYSQGLLSGGDGEVSRRPVSPDVAGQLPQVNPDPRHTAEAVPIRRPRPASPGQAAESRAPAQVAVRDRLSRPLTPRMPARTGRKTRGIYAG